MTRSTDAQIHDARPAPGTGRTADPSCWLVLGDGERATALTAELLAAGWRVENVLGGVSAAQQALKGPGHLPDMVVMSLDLADGDGLQMIRLLGSVHPSPAVFLLSQQQRAVIRAASRLAEVCNVPMAGVAEEPLEASGVMRQLEAWRLAPAQDGRHDPTHARTGGPPLDRDALLGVLADGRLQAWFQPQWRIRTGEIVGVEALMRAIDEDGHVILPDRLLPGLLKHGLMEAATLAILDQTAHLVADCLAQGNSLRAAVNAALDSMSDRTFCQKLPDVVAKAGLDPCWITIEVTESDTSRDIDSVIENTTRIRMLGFNLSIDDFGTSYSNMERLLAIPFSELKIDRSFVQGAQTDDTRRAIVRGCAGLGRMLGLDVVAEGIETESDLALVVDAGCSHAQGYLISPPQPAEEFQRWLAALPGMAWRPSTQLAVPNGRWSATNH